MNLHNRSFILCVSGGIAAYKSLELIRLLRKQGASVRVMPTQNALQFVGELSFEALSGLKCLTDSLSVEDGRISHIEEAERADAMIFAPATANMLAKMAYAMADTLPLQTLLSFRGPCIIAPAMESNMWEHVGTQENVSKLASRGCIFVGPNAGALASGRDGVGRMAEPEEIVEALIGALSAKDFANQRVLITAGPTVEDIDPVRFIANRSSGKMGVALARALAHRGATVQLIHGPMSSELPKTVGINAIAVRSAAQMLERVNENVDDCTLAVLCAAVADFTPAKKAESKMKKASGDLAQLALVPTVDILETIGKRKNKPFLVGFAAETENIVEEAIRKCKAKNADLICGNDAALAMDSESNEIVIVDRDKKKTQIPRAPKDDVAHAILDVVLAAMSDDFNSLREG